MIPPTAGLRITAISTMNNHVWIGWIAKARIMMKRPLVESSRRICAELFRLVVCWMAACLEYQEMTD